MTVFKYTAVIYAEIFVNINNIHDTYVQLSVSLGLTFASHLSPYIVFTDQMYNHSYA